MRPFIVSSGTGLEKSSYSLQYSQESLQRRIGMMCARIGWSVDAKPLAIIFNSRIRRLEAITRRCMDGDDFCILNHSYYNTSCYGPVKSWRLCGDFWELSGVVTQSAVPRFSALPRLFRAPRAIAA